MNSNGASTNGDVQVLRWPGKVLCADDLRRHWHGHRELVVSQQTIITPLAADELRDRGIQVRRQVTEEASTKPAGGWALAQEQQDGIVRGAIRALEREGVCLSELMVTEKRPCRWAKKLAEGLTAQQYVGLVAFCHDPGLVCCVANKVRGVRAVPIINVAQARRAMVSIAPNFLAIEMPGRTIFEIRQIVRTVCQGGQCVCPEETTHTLQELEGHAHR